jgi:ComEC/Rec2-related protein
MAPAQVIWFGIIAFIVGIFFSGSDLSLFWPLLFTGIVLGILVFRRPGFWPLFITLPSIVIGALYYQACRIESKAAITVPFGKSIEARGIIVDEPSFSGQSESFPIELEAPYHGTIRILVGDENLSYGDEVQVSGTVAPADSELASPSMLFPAIRKTAEHRASRIRELLLGVKQRVLAPFLLFLPSEEATFMGGLTFGAKSRFSKTLTADLRASGTTHLVAISGYNVQLITVAVFGWFLKILRRRIAFFATIALLMAFVTMVGGTPSVVRAAIMGFLFLFSKEIGRIFSFDYVILWTAFIMVLLDPTVLFSPGFALSYISLLGIVYLSPAIVYFFRKGQEEEGSFAVTVAQTLAAGIAVIPVTLAFFGSFSLTSFLANIAILPFIPFTTLLGFALAGIALIVPPLGYALGFLAHILLAYELSVIHFFAKFGVPVQIPGTPLFVGLIYYLALLGFIFYAERSSL